MANAEVLRGVKQLHRDVVVVAEQAATRATRVVHTDVVRVHYEIHDVRVLSVRHEDCGLAGPFRSFFLLRPVGQNPVLDEHCAADAVKPRCCYHLLRRLAAELPGLRTQALETRMFRLRMHGA